MFYIYYTAVTTKKKKKPSRDNRRQLIRSLSSKPKRTNSSHESVRKLHGPGSVIASSSCEKATARQTTNSDHSSPCKAPRRPPIERPTARSSATKKKNSPPHKLPLQHSPPPSLIHSMRVSRIPSSSTRQALRPETLKPND